MTVPKHPGRNLFVNIPVENLGASVAFFTTLGFTFDARFTNETGTCMLVGEQAFFMLLTKARFREMAPADRALADLSLVAPAGYAFSVHSREEVDRIADLALANGGIAHGEPEDHGFMYSRPFRDPNGHHFDVLWMDPVAAEQGPEAHAASTNA